MTSDRAPGGAGLSEAKQALLRELLKGKPSAAASFIPRRSPGAGAPLSFAQQRLWFIHRMHPESPAYNVPNALRLRGALDVDVLRRSLDEIRRRHESLRTRIVTAGDRPEQVVDPPVAAELPIVDLEPLPAERRMAAAEEEAAREAAAPFHLERGPLLRTRLLRLAADDHVFLVTMHHVVSDGWSMGVFVRELAELYGAFARGAESPLPELPLQYPDFAVWQRGTLSGDRLEAELAHWRARLFPPAAPLELPADRPRPPEQTFRGGVAPVTVPAGVAEPLRRLARSEGATLFMVLLAAWDALLARLTGQTDVVVGTGVAGRTLPELEPLIGFFVNALPLRVSCAGDPTFRELLARARETTLAAFAHQDVPFERLVEELQPVRDLSRNPLFQVLFELQNAPEEDFELPGISVSPVAAPAATTRFDLELHLWEAGDGSLDGAMSYSADLFEASTARRILERWAKILAQIAADPDRRLADLDIATEADVAVTREREQGPALTVPAATAVERFEAQAARAPEAIAIEDGVRRLTYGELDERAGRIAARLRRAGAGPESRVAVLAHRSIEQATAVVGAAKSRAAWVPIDPANPDDRILSMLDRAGAEIVLVDEACRARVGTGRTVLAIADALAGDPGSPLPPPPRSSPANLSHVIFTSGSTGEPKGVELTHGNLASFIAWHRNAFDLGPRDRVTMVAGLGFDASAWDMWPTLASGACLLVPEEAVRLDPAALRDWIVETEATVSFLATPLAELVVPLDWPRRTALRYLLTGGDRLHAVRASHAPFRFINGYGPTETTIVVVTGEIDSGGSLPFPTLGRPNANCRVLILDRNLRRVPPGVTGELWIGGVQVGRGYAGRPDLTAERFVPDPTSPEPGARMYRTGDRGRRLEDGRLEFLGRVDDQVKIRGQRVEPGESAAVLSACPLVELATVVAREVRGETALVAYVVPRAPSAADALVPELRAWMTARLPDSLVPSAFVLLDAIPFTPNGKIDKRALPDPGEMQPGRTGPRVAPRTATEKRVARIWSEVIEVEEVFAGDDFFALGGHSLLATQVLARLRSELGVELPLRTVFDASTLEALAAEVDERAPAGPGADAPIRARGLRRAPLSLAQQRLWFIDRFEPGAAAYHIANALRLEGALDIDALAEALTEIVARHEALRTRFPETDEGPEQEIEPPFPVRLVAEDVPGATPEARREAAVRLVGEEAAAPFDLRTGPVLRARLFRLGPREHVLSLVVHHIAADGWSVGLLVRELGALYEAHVSGRADGLDPLPIQYPDWAVWQREWMDGGELDRQLAFWREALSGVRPLSLPTDRPRPPRPSYRGEALDVDLEAPLVAQLGEIARGRGATLHMALLAGFAAVLAEWSGQDDFAVGTPVAGRSRREIEPLVGFFVNTLAVRLRLDGAPLPYAALLDRVRESALAAYANQDVPFERIVEEVRPARDTSRNPLFQTLFALQNVPLGELRLPGLTIGPFELEARTAQFDLELTLFEIDGRASGRLQWSADLFDRATMRAFADRFRSFLEAAAADPGVEVVVPRGPARAADADGHGGPDGATAPEDGPAQAPRDADARATAAPSPLEALVASAAEHVLGVSGLGPDDDFFERGGHSLLATRLVARLRRVANVEVPVRAVFEGPTVRELAATLDAAMREEAAPSRIPRAAPADRPPLSFQQERMWFLHRLDPAGSADNVFSALSLRGELDADALGRALTALAARHETLRARFESVDGRPVQVVDAPAAVEPVRVDLEGAADPERELAVLLESEAAAPFDLQRGPLWRATLARLAPDRHAFALTMHHIVTDGWSMGIVVRELGALYDAACTGEIPAGVLPELPIRYADYAVWQRRWLEGGELERQLGNWRETLAGVEPLELPTDLPRPPSLGQRGIHVRAELDAELAARLRDFARAEGATLHMVLLAAYALVLSRWSGQEDFAVGVPVANRTREETEGLIGYFVNTLALRMNLRTPDDGVDHLTVRELIARVRETSLAAYANQDVPFESLLDILRPPRDLSRSPVFQVWFNLVNVPEEEARFGTLEAHAAGAASTDSRFDVNLYVFQAGDALLLDAIGNAELFREWRVRELLDQLELALRAMTARPEAPVDDVELVTGRARAVIPDPGRALADDWAGSIPERLGARADEDPDAVAVQDAHGAWTYRELDERAGRLAGRLRAAGVGPGDPVAVLAHRSAPTVCAMLGVLRAGAATVMLDPAHPVPRLAACLREARVRAVIGMEAGGEPPPELLDAARELGAAFLRLPAGARDIDAALRDAAAPPLHDARPDDLACITFTSGSTGTPKGVRGAHGPLTHFQAELERRFGIGPDDRFSLLSGLAHDPLQRDVFTPLLAGARICVPSPEDLDPGRLARWVAAEGVTVAHLSPAMLKILAGDPTAPAIDGLRLVLSVGEQLTRRDVRRLRAVAPHATVVNLYGTTETQRAVGHFVVPPGDPLRGEDGRPLELEAIPAGTGLGDVQLLVLRDGDRPAGLGELGEIRIRSPHLALGYLDEALTRERFHGEGSSRAYLTGDLGRYLPDGGVAVAGRRDREVNVRGFRVHLGEVEAAVASHPDVGDAVCATDAAGRLVAWVTPRADRRPDPHAVREAARERVPEAMVPWTVVGLDAIPFTPNGKVDRRALPAPPEAAVGTGAAPRTPEEEIACRLFADVLGADAVGPADDFFDLGGHSLLAVRLLARAGAAFRAEIPLRALFAAPTPAGLARAALEARRSGRAPAGGVRRTAERERRKPSFAQQRLWVIDRLVPDSAAYHLPAALKLTGELDPAALERALIELERRHESLRARFPSGPDGAEQVFDEPRRRILSFADLRATDAGAPTLTERLAGEAALPFDLERGPLWRARLFRTGEREHVLLLVLHHIVTDGWSNEILTRELAALYEAFADDRDSPLPDPLLQYADWAAWQRTWLEGGELERQLAWWERELDGAAPLSLPTDRPRGPRRGLRGTATAVALPDGDAAALAGLAREENATLFHVLLAAYQALLARFCGADDVTVGTPVANRSAPEAEGLVGFFANTLALRTRVDPRRSFRDLLGAVREKTLDAHANQDVPFEVVVDALHPERDLSRNPLFDAMFVLRHDGERGDAPARLAVEPFPVETGATAFDVTLVLGESGGRIAGELQVDADLFEAATAARLAAAFATLVREAVRRPDSPLAELELRSPEERALVAATNDTARPLPDRTLADLVAEHAAQAPESVAVADEERELTYAELDRRAEAIAGDLRAAGVRGETAVGLLAGRNVSAVAGMLGIWKAGGVYVPLDPAQPRERHAVMLRDAGVRIVLAERGLEAALPDPAMPIVRLERAPADAPPTNGGPAHAGDSPPPDDPARLRQAAYVIFTSGSTGEPKGSVVEHLAMTARAVATAREEGLRPGVRSLCFFPLPWDGSLHEMLPALAAGATIVMHPDPRGDTPQDFFRRCERHGIGAAFCPVGFLHELADDLARTGGSTPTALRHLTTGGDAPRPADVAGILRAARPGLTFTNVYGPTETVVVATGENVRLEDVERGVMPIGRPFAHATAHLLDAALRPVPIGAVGEIFLGGPVLARGYAGRPDLTATSFLPDPFSPEPGARMYRTGDLARRLDDGRLVFVGRRDGQLKIRGFRVELGEVEHALNALPDVAEGVVVARRTGAEAQLAAYFVPAGGTSPDAGAVRAALRERLPDYMLPAAVVPLEALPRTRTGKLDRRALPAPEAARPRGVRIGPRTEAEHALAPLWQEILGLPDVDVDESFFEAGGNSLLAIRLTSAVRRELDVELPVAAVFREPTLAGLARTIAGGLPDGDGVALVRLRIGDGARSLVCFPPVGGGVADFAELAEQLPSGWTVWAIPALDGPTATEGVESAADACAGAIASSLPEGPLQLLGWSWGAHVAFETARRLEAAGRKIAMLALVDAPAAGDRSAPAAVPANDPPLPADLAPEDAARWLAGIEARRAALARYRPRPWDGSALVIRGTESVAGRDRDASLGWSALVRGPVRVEWSPGSHESLLSGDGARAVAALVERHAAAADRRESP